MKGEERRSEEKRRSAERRPRVETQTRELSMREEERKENRTQ
jgi:hypothetical protein